MKKKIEGSCVYNSAKDTIKITLDGSIREERIRSFRIDLERLKLAVRNERKTNEEAGLWIIRHYPDFEKIYQHLITRIFLVICNEYESGNYIFPGQDDTQWAFERYNELVKDLSELKKLNLRF